MIIKDERNSTPIKEGDVIVAEGGNHYLIVKSSENFCYGVVSLENNAVFYLDEKFTSIEGFYADILQHWDIDEIIPAAQIKLTITDKEATV